MESGEVVLGCFIRYPDSTLAELVSLLGWDFLVFDGEHGEVDTSDLANLSRASQLHEVTPIARVPSHDPHWILRSLDAGCQGLHLPSLATYDQVVHAVASSKYPPEGSRGLAATRASQWSLTETLDAYTKRANREILTIVHVESIEAVEEIERWVTIDGLDILFIGPTDLAQSLGHPGFLAHPDVVRAIDRVAEIVTGSDKTLGIFAPTAEAALEWVERGARYVATGLEGLIRSSAADFVSRVRA